MLNINGKSLCESCFAQLDTSSAFCTECGFRIGTETSQPMMLPMGTILLGKYVIGKVLGKGGFGVTYLAYNVRDEKRVAIKEYLPDSLVYRGIGDSAVSTYGGDKDIDFKAGAEKFYEEAKTIARFNGHPNIIHVHEFFYENGTAYFAMEYVDGIDLKNHIAEKGGRLSEKEMLTIMLPLMDALMIVHSVGVLHRDISPDNIYITKDNTVKLLDFGAARQVLGEQSKSLSVVLKPGFAPLEQYQTRGKQGPWTDVYALSATMYFCLTGKVPESAMDRLEEDRLVSPVMMGAVLHPANNQAIMRGMSLKAADRFQNTIELKQALALDALHAPAAAPQQPVQNTTAVQPPVQPPVYQVTAPASEQPIPAQPSVPVAPPAQPAAPAPQRPAQKVQPARPSPQRMAQKQPMPSKKKMVIVLSSVAGGVVLVVAMVIVGISLSNAAKHVNLGGGGGGGGVVDTTTVSQLTATATPDVTETVPATIENTIQPTVTVTATQSQQTKPPSGGAQYVHKTYGDGSVYDGYMENGKYNGQGTLVYKDSDKYVGNWVDDQRSGQGTYTWHSEGNKYTGHWSNNRINGQGTMWYGNGDKYVGNWSNDLKSGQGTYTYSDGRKYVGSFAHDDYNGYGKYYDKNGHLLYSGNWKDGESVG